MKKKRIITTAQRVKKRFLVKRGKGKAIPMFSAKKFHH